MTNEFLLLGSVILIYGLVLVAYQIFGKSGLYIMIAIVTIFANIEVLMLIDGFGMKQTLGNVMFASTYLITDILSENEGKKCAAKAVWIGVFSAVVMLIFTQYMGFYLPAESDWAGKHLTILFSRTPRIVLASLTSYVVSQRFDVWLYHFWWDLTEKKTGSHKRFLWLRNNCSTLISQVVNTLVFTSIAFVGVYNLKNLVFIMFSSYVIFIFTSLLDTPVVYIARYLKQNKS